MEYSYSIKDSFYLKMCISFLFFFFQKVGGGGWAAPPAPPPVRAMARVYCEGGHRGIVFEETT